MKIYMENPLKMVLDVRIPWADYLCGIMLILCAIHLLISNPGNLETSTIKPYPIGAALFSIILAIVFFLLAKTIKVELDKTTGKGVIIFSTLLKKQTNEFQLKNIQEIVMQKNIYPPSLETGAWPYYEYILLFVTKDGRSFPVSFGRIKSGLIEIVSSEDEERKKEGQRVADFLGVGFRFAVVEGAKTASGQRPY